MKTFIVAATLAAFVLTSAAWSQVVTIGTGTLQNTTTTTPTPYGNYYKGQRLQSIILASELAAAGMTATSFSTIGWDVVTPGGQALQDFEIKLGHTTAMDLSGGWASAATFSVYGPTTYQDVVGWNDHVLWSPFSWNGIDNLLVEVCFWNGTASSYTTNAVVNYDLTPFVSSLTYRSDSVPSCSAPNAPQYSESERPNMRFTTGPVIPPTYQMNSPEATLDINGAQQGAYAPTVVSQDAYLCGPGSVDPVTGSMNISTTGVQSLVYELVMDTSPIVPVGGGGIAILGGVLNLDVASAANWTYLNGGTALDFQPFPGLGIPGVTGANLSLPYSISSQMDMSLQGAFVAPTFATGLKLTQATEFHVSVVPPLASIPGPTSSFTNVEIDVTGGATCWAPGGVPFYGSLHSTIYVSPNGSICFGGGGDTDGSPSLYDATNDDGRVGFWTDLDPSEGGTINILNPGPDVIRVEWAGVWYNTGGPGTTFAVEIDCLTGTILIDGLQGLVANPNVTSTTDDQWLGMSPGITAVTTDPGAQAFAANGTGAAALATDMLYEFNDVSVSLSGLPASVVGGMNQLLFIPDGLGNYVWSGF